MNEYLKIGLVALVVVIVYEKFLKEAIDKMGGSNS